jgi:hypothetical protein
MTGRVEGKVAFRRAARPGSSPRHSTGPRGHRRDRRRPVRARQLDSVRYPSPQRVAAVDHEHDPRLDATLSRRNQPSRTRALLQSHRAHSHTLSADADRARRVSNDDRAGALLHESIRHAVHRRSLDDALCADFIRKREERSNANGAGLGRWMDVVVAARPHGTLSGSTVILNVRYGESAVISAHITPVLAINHCMAVLSNAKRWLRCGSGGLKGRHRPVRAGIGASG